MRAGVVAISTAFAHRDGLAADPTELPPTRVITRGPKHHWFGYYDKLQFDRTQRYVLGMQVAFEHRSPKPDDAIKIGMVDIKDNDRWIELGKSHAWCWQQGCMLQWLPGSATKVLWNDPRLQVGEVANWNCRPCGLPGPATCFRSSQVIPVAGPFRCKSNC